MKAITVLFALLGLTECGVISSPYLLRTPSLDTAIVKSERVGSNFAYSTVENHAYTPVQYSVVQPYYTRQLFGSPVYPVGQHPFFVYPGQGVLQSPVIGQNPLYPVLQNPGIGSVQYPIQNPIQNPVQLPVEVPQGVPQQDIPATGTLVDNDTVSVEAAS